MSTYQLNAGELLTLLQSTVTPSSVSLAVGALVQNGDFLASLTPAGLKVETQLGPPAASGVADDTVSAGVKFELITLPTSTSTGPILTQPTIGSTTPAETFNFINTAGPVTFMAGDQAVTIVDTSVAGGDTLIGGAGFEKLQTTGGANLLIGGSGSNTLTAGSGNDTLLGGSGSSLLQGGGHSVLMAGTGNQTLKGGFAVTAVDTLIGGSGDDVLRAFKGNDSLVGGTGKNTLYSGINHDTLVGGGDSHLIARAQTSILGGSATLITSSLASGHDTLKAEIGDDSMQSVAGHNRLVAGSGNDTVSLGSGHDTLIGGTGNLTVDGGMGAARVVLQAGGVTDSILGGAGSMVVASQESSANLVSNSSTAVGGLHTLTFTDGQTIIVNDANSNIVIHFSNGGSTPV